MNVNKYKECLRIIPTFLYAKKFYTYDFKKKFYTYFDSQNNQNIFSFKKISKAQNLCLEANKVRDIHVSKHIRHTYFEFRKKFLKLKIFLFFCMQKRI